VATWPLDWHPNRPKDTFPILLNQTRILKVRIFSDTLERMKEADSFFGDRMKLVLLAFPVQVILADNEGTRRSVPRFSGTVPIHLMDE
jgi:hypothetical protein